MLYESFSVFHWWREYKDKNIAYIGVIASPQLLIAFLHASFGRPRGSELLLLWCEEW
jgi:hypothetical protein